MAPSTLSARGFMRGRNRLGNSKPADVLTARNKAAKKAAREAWFESQAILKKAGVTRQTFLGKGIALMMFLKAAAITLPHGFSPLSPQPTYRHLHATKGYRSVPA